jgi:hypothetical protein
MRKIAITGLLFLIATTAARAQTKQIPISVRVEAEGGTKGQGLWAQEAQDLTPRELKTIESLVVGEIAKQNGVEIVPLDYSESDFIGVAVVAAKLPKGNARNNWYYIASSALIVSTKKGDDEFLTHNIFAASDLESLARNVSLQFAAARLGGAIGLLRK